MYYGQSDMEPQQRTCEQRTSLETCYGCRYFDATAEKDRERREEDEEEKAQQSSTAIQQQLRNVYGHNFVQYLIIVSDLTSPP